MAINISQIPAPRVPLVDSQTNTVSREWFMWFNNVYSVIGNGTGITAVANGGTGLGTIPGNGQLLIGNGTGYSLRTLFAGTGISITNGSGAISITNSLPDQTVVLNGAGTNVVTGTYPDFTITSTAVTSVNGAGSVNGITLTGTVTSSGNLTLGGTLSGVDLTSQVTGILPVANGGTGTSTPGVTATITTAKLTSLGSNGSMTFVNGLLTAQTPAT
jgi:hypothetical protein